MKQSYKENPIEREFVRQRDRDNRVEQKHPGTNPLKACVICGGKFRGQRDHCKLDCVRVANGAAHTCAFDTGSCSKPVWAEGDLCNFHSRLPKPRKPGKPGAGLQSFTARILEISADVVPDQSEDKARRALEWAMKNGREYSPVSQQV